MNMHVPEDAFNHEDAWVSHDLLNYQLSLGCYAYVEELLCLMTLIRWLPISKLYTSMSFDFSLLFYADAVWLGNCVVYLHIFGVYFVSARSLHFSMWDVILTNGLNCLPLQVLYV